MVKKNNNMVIKIYDLPNMLYYIRQTHKHNANGIAIKLSISKYVVVEYVRLCTIEEWGIHSQSSTYYCIFIILRVNVDFTYLHSV